MLLYYICDINEIHIILLTLIKYRELMLRTDTKHCVHWCELCDWWELMLCTTSFLMLGTTSVHNWCCAHHQSWCCAGSSLGSPS